MTLKKRITAYLLIGILALAGAGSWLYHQPKAQTAENAQTDVDRAEHLFDGDGVPYLRIAGAGKQRHPAWVAIYALAYAGVDVYDPRLANLKDDNKFAACIKWLEANLKQQPSGLWVWEYGFDNTYNDITIKAPWSSAFAQATGIQALLAAYHRDGNRTHLELAQKAAQPLFAPIKQGGFLFQSGADVWFEEIPVPADNPSHILNGHMRVLLALKELADVLGDETIKDWYLRGSNTLYRWLPRYDSGYWLRYDLNPRKQDLLFRLANPYGFTNHPLAVDKITLRDPISKQEVLLDIGSENDAEGAQRVAGIHWGQREQLAGRSVRRLEPATIENKPDELAAPHSYFYLPLPGALQDNLRDQWYELAIDYYDDAPANLTVQMRSIAPGQMFHGLRDGDLHLTGAKHWRRWIIPVRPSDLGYWVGLSYAEKHAAYLNQLARWDSRFAAWAQVASGYQLLAIPIDEKGQDNSKVDSLQPLPKQTPMLPIYSLDTRGVLMQHLADNDTLWNSDGMFNPSGSQGVPVYSPYIVAEQLRQGNKATVGVYSEIDRKNIRRQPALRWLLNTENYRQVRNSAIYTYKFDNAYNDILTKAPWPSAFGQAYVVKSLVSAAEGGLAKNIHPAIAAAASAFSVDVKDGGIHTKDRAGQLFFEEVPNATHVLNAHLVSVPELAHAGRLIKDPEVQLLASAGIATLKERLHLFDTGYWLRYDQNPKKELLIQLDWLEGEQSPLIDEILLQNPQTGRVVRIDVGGGGDSEGVARISGAEWRLEQSLEGRNVRGFGNGYEEHAQPVPGGARHNAYLLMGLPEREFADFFDVPVHRLVIRYKDVAPGRFGIKTQAIHEGNQLVFVPLRGGVWQATGDQQWKEASFLVRPQDMGWYKGPDYQQYEVDQLQRIANKSNDWFFYQYAERQRDYLEAQREGRPVIFDADAAKIQPPVNLSVVAASQTYPGHGFENSIDGDPNDDYSAGFDNLPSYVVLRLSRSANLAALRLHWESANNVARHVIVSRANTDNTAGKKLADVRNLQGLTSQVPLSDARAVDSIRIDFSEFEGQPRILLRQIEVTESPTDSAQSIQEAINPDGIYLDATDVRNPLRIFRAPVTQRIKILSDKLAAGARSDHEKVMRFMGYINQFRVGFASSGSPDATVNERIGACGSFTNVLLALSMGQGIPGRFVNMWNYPEFNGHTVAELYISGQWRLYDPTYNAYYVSKRKSDELPLSFDQIQEAYRTKPASVHRVTTTYRPGIEEFTGKEIFVKAEPAGVIGLDRPMVFPLTLDVKKMSVLDRSSFGVRYQGADYLGASSTNQNQEWRLSSLTLGHVYTFTITPKEIGGDIDARDLTFRLQASLYGGELLSDDRHVFDFSQGGAGAWQIRFKASEPEARLQIMHPYRGPDIRYMAIERYTLEQVMKVGE